MKIIDRLYKIFPATFPRFHITIERWKFNDQYKVWVSNQGNVMNENKTPRQIKVSNKGYMVCLIGHNLVTMHRLVMLTWEPRKDADSLTVDHKNSNKRDNRLCNLEWVSEGENLRRAQENFIQIPVTEIEKQAQRMKQRQKEKELYNGYSKEQYNYIVLEFLTSRFMQGTVWVESSGFVVNKDNFKKVTTEKSGWPAGVEERQVARKYICAAYGGSKSYCGKKWKLCGATHVEIAYKEDK